MKPLISLAIPFVTIWTLSAQTTSDPAPPFPLWTAPLPNAQGAYVVSLNSICSVALEHYDLKYDDKTYPVTECSIETVGGKTARFYFVDDGKPENEDESPAGQVVEAVGTLVPVLTPEEQEEEQKKLRVVKAYPESALTGTVEYRLSSKAKVEALYKDLRDTWVASSP